MDQDSFRQLLHTPNASGSTPTARGSLLAKVAKPKTVDSSKPAFQPRKVKKTPESKYRDRAGERRVGEGNDYAQIEAVLEDFERQTKDAKDKSDVESKRKYLGGDGDHSILVKGLDFALLEQNKARASLNADDDESLEQAFLEVASEASTSVPKKRTREDLLRELKKKRTQQGDGAIQVAKSTGEEVRLLEEAKQKGKFKPIGFKPIGPSSEGKKKKAKSEGKDGERKKKKRKVKAEDKSAEKDERSSIPLPVKPAKHPEPEPEPVDEEFDIFAGAGDYQGVELGDDDEDDGDNSDKNADNTKDSEQEHASSAIPRRWIPTDEPDLIHAPESSSSRAINLRSSPEPPSMLSAAHVPEVDEEEELPMRLVPLASSALPDIKELLKMDKAANNYDKNRKRKDKKKGGGDNGGNEAAKTLTAEAKAERDYKRLKSYTDKKAGAPGAK